MPLPPRTALVLGGGGIAGGAWMVGALHAVAAETGWSPGTADFIVGTSAGAMIGALIASGVEPELMVASGRGGGAGTDFGTEFRPHWSFPRPVLGSPGLAFRSLREPWRYGPAGIVAWLPHGVISTQPLQAAIKRVVPTGWSPHENLWIVAIDYETGDRVVFGRAGAPRPNLYAAVAASCAVPGFYHPVTINDHRYVDGGVYSPSNADVLLTSDSDVVVCLSPMTSRSRGHLLAPNGPIASFVRGNPAGRLSAEVAALERNGKRVLVIQPCAEDERVMGYNYMSGRHREQITETAIRTTSAALRRTEAGRTLASLAGADGRRTTKAAGREPASSAGR